MAHRNFNRDELITRILEKHRVIGEGQSATEDQRQKADQVIDPTTDELRHRGIISIDPDSHLGMPVRYKENLAEVCAFYCAEDFFRVPDETKKVRAEVRLRAIEAMPPTFQTTAVDPLHAPSYAAGYPRYYKGGYR